MAAAPPNFSWVEPKKLAGLAYPCTAGHYQFLFDSGIQHLVSLCESLPPHHDSCPGLQVHHIGIVDFTPPSSEQIRKFLSIVEAANSKDQVSTFLSVTRLSDETESDLTRYVFVSNSNPALL